MATAKKVPLTTSSVYRNFIAERDKALEVIHTKTQAKVSDVLRGTFTRVMEIVSYHYPKGRGSVALLSDIDKSISEVFAHSTLVITGLIGEMRKRVYLLSYAGEAEAIGRATGKTHNVNASKGKLNSQFHAKTFAGAELIQRVQFTLDKLKRRILDQVQLSAIQDDSLEDLTTRIFRVLPEHKVVKLHKRVLKVPKLKEASSPTGQYKLDNQNSMLYGFIDDADWTDMVDEYESDYVPKNRGPEELDLQLGEGTPQYAWELEKEVTQDFVQQVRDGQIDAANQNGYTDFVWIAIVDDKTDDCCLWRDGKTTKEIELALNNEKRNDECDATTPPAHFNCRCTLAPITDEMPEQPELNIGDFSEWLNQTASP